MNPKLAILQCRLNISMPEKIPAPDTGLGAQIEALVSEAIQAQVADAFEQRSPKVDRLIQGFNKPKPVSDYRQLPPVQKTPAPKAMELQFQRDELGRVNVVNVGNQSFRVQRNEVGQIVRMVPADIAPMPPAIEPPFLAKARQYQVNHDDY